MTPAIETVDSSTYAQVEGNVDGNVEIDLYYAR